LKLAEFLLALTDRQRRLISPSFTEGSDQRFEGRHLTVIGGAYA
jgi:hypothetical protein